MGDVFNGGRAEGLYQGDGLRRLFMLERGREMRYLRRNLPEIQTLCLLYAGLTDGDGRPGQCEELVEDLILAVVDGALQRGGGTPRDADAFEACADRAARDLMTIANDLCAGVGETLRLYSELRRRVHSAQAPALAAVFEDIDSQLAWLVYPGFVRETPAPRLQHLPRYLRGVELRLQRLASGAARDEARLREVAPLWHAA